MLLCKLSPVCGSIAQRAGETSETSTYRSSFSSFKETTMRIDKVVDRVSPSWRLKNSKNKVKHPIVGHFDNNGRLLFARPQSAIMREKWRNQQQFNKDSKKTAVTNRNVGIVLVYFVRE